MIKLISRYTVSWLLIVLILFLSFFKISDPLMEDVPFIDKWTHITMYLVLSSSLWIEYLRSHTRICYKRLCIEVIVLPVVMGGVIEFIQGYCTTYRSGDWMDFIANSLGVAISAILGFAWYRYRFLKKA